MTPPGAGETVRLRVNGRERTCRVRTTTTLQALLHARLSLHEVRYGCGEGVCGSCVVLMDGRPVPSCLLLAVRCSGADVRTAGHLADRPAVRRFLAECEERQSFQCGYCASGFLVSVAHLLERGRGWTPDEIREALAGHVCRCSGYAPIVEAVEAAAREAGPASGGPDDLPAQGPVVRKATGRVRFPSDRSRREALVGKVVWSDHASARVEAVEVDHVRARDGVLAVVTAMDIPGRNVSGINVFGGNHRTLAEDEVRTVGDPLALVAARDDAVARSAVEEVRVSYEPTPSVHDPVEALEGSSPSVRGGSNVVSQYTFVQGDVEEGFRQAEKVVTGRYRCGFQDHACLEPEGGTGWMEGDTVVLEVPTQTPHTARKAVSRLLGIPERRVRIRASRSGGSFGKYLVTGIEGMLALLVDATRRPVRLVLERGEALRRSVKRNPFVGSYRLGLDGEGRFTALEADLLADSGPYESLTPAVASIFASEVAGPYRIPHVRARVRAVLTNNLPTAPMRGFGSQQVSFGIEAIVDRAVRATDLTAGELRRLNLVSGRPAPDGGWRDDPALGLDEALDVVGERLGRLPSPPADGWLVGRGLAVVHAKAGFYFGMRDPMVARAGVDADGEFRVETAIPDAGTGAPRGLATLASETLGLDRLPAYRQSREAAGDRTGDLFGRGKRAGRLRTGLFRVLESLQTGSATVIQLVARRLSADTQAGLFRLLARPVNFFARLTGAVKGRLYPWASDTYNPRVGGSRSIILAGRAVRRAASALREAALETAAAELGLPTGRLEAGGEGVFVAEDPGRRMSWGEVAAAAGGELYASARAENPGGRLLDPATGNQIGPVDYLDAVHGCDLAVHPRTGETRVLAYVACDDVGCAINPEVIRGQVTGGVVMGLGQALMEDLRMEAGRPGVEGLHEYHVPSILDVPGDLEIVSMESGGGLGPGGAKGIGETGAVAAPIAISNALHDALGVQPRRLPVTAERIVELAGSGGGQGDSGPSGAPGGSEGDLT